MDYRDLDVYKLGLEAFRLIVEDVKNFPDNTIGKIIMGQVIRSISSITANIAEGYGRQHGKEYLHYLYISRGSATESIDWYEKMKILGYIEENIYNERIDRLEHIRAMLTKMINTLL